MKSEETVRDELKWQCERCRCDIVSGPVTVEYMGNRFTTDLPHCPSCGMVLVSEETALGKMAQVEQMLEDK
ncbi:MAG: hypothetical protein PHC90_08800 [Syntrophorhabdaceae bacterium]|nr:hypothetical protein [Syntrophorhabdaceae bacterium]